MTMVLGVLLVGTLLMLQSDVTLSVEPGKQLPQALTVQVPDGGASRDETIHYLLFTPAEYETDERRWPLLLFLHGLGECGNNELDRVKIHGPPKLVETRPDFPFVLVAPQCPPPPGGIEDVPKAWKAEQLIKLVDHICDQMRIDRSRVYVTGLSMGGFGTWRLVAAYPDRFAAAAPICGGGEPQGMATSLRRIPIWAFHGERDSVVPLARSREMVDAVSAAGGRVRLTVYRDVEHDSWTRTYDNPELYDWLLSHRRPRP
jgi:predicted peptidase